MRKTLLPTGCYDVLPPYARQEFQLSAAMLNVFEGFGYEQVSPPLLEYSESLLAGRGSALSPQIFRVMDPSAHKVMGIRTDITPQIARIASSRLAQAPRPLRLCYNGLILRMQGEQLQSNRQLRQAGIELIGAGTAAADAEVILVAATALGAAGIHTLSIDLNLPGLVGSLLAHERLEAEDTRRLFEAIAQKDISTLDALPISYRETLIRIIQSAGPARAALDTIKRLDMPDAAKRQCSDLEEVVSLLETLGQKEWTLTIDAVESRNYDYHSGLGFSIFVPGAACEVGRGGRYMVENTEATGFTLYIETLRNLLPEPKTLPRVYVPEGLGQIDTQKLREEGYAVLFAMEHEDDSEAEAKRLGCEYILKNGKAKKLS